MPVLIPFLGDLSNDLKWPRKQGVPSYPAAPDAASSAAAPVAPAPVAAVAAPIAAAVAAPVKAGTRDEARRQTEMASSALDFGQPGFAKTAFFFYISL